MRWSRSEMLTLYQSVKPHEKTRKEKTAFQEVAKQLGKSEGACRQRYSRTDWGSFVAAKHRQRQAQPWTKQELSALYSSKMDFDLKFVEIGGMLERSPISCERKFQNMDWDSFIAENPKSSEDPIETFSPAIQDEESDDQDQEAIENRFIDLFVKRCRQNVARLLKTTEEEYLDFVIRRFEKDGKKFDGNLPLPFPELKKRAYTMLEQRGDTYPKTGQFGPGRYLVVGDSHGRETDREMFDLLQYAAEKLDIQKVIHVGHIFDADDDVSYLWDGFGDKLVIIGYKDERPSLKLQKPGYEVYQEHVRLGNNLAVGNQYDIKDFTYKYLGGVRDIMLPGRCCIVNSHRHELFNACVHDIPRIVASPGCICDKHIMFPLKQVKSSSGIPEIRETHPYSFDKYARQDSLKEAWEQGAIIVDIDKDGDFNIHMTRIRMTSRGYAMSYFDKIIVSGDILEPDEKILVTADAHCEHHDTEVLDIQEQFAADYGPDKYVNLGDQFDNRGLSHWARERSGGPVPVQYLNEVAAASHVTSKQRKWAPEFYFIFGNHERFALDFLERYPQLAELLDIRLLLDFEKLGIHMTDHKKTLNIDPIKFIHGDQKMFGQNGHKLDQVQKTYGENTVMGNIHYPAIRLGIYSVGMSAVKDHGYNEPEASQWLPGLAYCNIFDGQGFVSLVNILDSKCSIDGKTYVPENPTAWECPPFKARLSFYFDQQGSE